MAKVGSARFSNLSQYELWLDVIEESKSVWNNTSVVSVMMKITKHSGSGYWNNDSFSTTITVNGSKRTITVNGYDFQGGTPMTRDVWSKREKFTVTHNSDGGKSVSISASASIPNNGYTRLGNASVSGSFGLTKFNRAASINSAPSSFVVNDGFSVSFSSQSGGLSYELLLQNSSGGKTYQTFTGLPNGGTYKVNPSSGAINNIYNDMTSSSGISLRIQIVTKSGSSVIARTNRNITAIPKSISVWGGGGSLTLGNTRNVGLNKHHTGSKLRVGYCRRNNGEWFNGYPITSSDSTVSLPTSGAAFKREVLSVSPGSTTQSIAIWFDWRNANNVRLGYVEQAITIVIPAVSVSISGTSFLKSLDIKTSVSGVSSSHSNTEYSLNGGSWKSASGANFSITGLNSGTGYTVRVRVQQSGSSVWYYSTTNTYRTINKFTLSVPAGPLMVDSSISVTKGLGSGLSSKYWVTNEAGTTIYGPVTDNNNTVSHRFGYKELGMPGTNNSNYNKKITFHLEGTDGKGSKEYVTVVREYNGYKLPTATVDPKQTTSEGYLTARVVDASGSPTMSKLFTLKRKIDSKIIVPKTGMEDSMYTHFFNESDFDDLFDKNDYLDFEAIIEVSHGSVPFAYVTHTVRVLPNAELLVYNKGKWVKPTVFRLRGNTVPYPGINLSPGLDTVPANRNFVYKDAVESVSVFSNNKWTKGS